MYAAPVDCIAARAHTARRPTNHGAVSPIVLINKLDNSDQKANEFLNETFDLFLA